MSNKNRGISVGNCLHEDQVSITQTTWLYEQQEFDPDFDFDFDEKISKYNAQRNRTKIFS